MTTPNPTLWNILEQNMPRNKWTQLTELYKIIEDNFNEFTVEDLKHYSGTTGDYNWQHSLRNALQTRKNNGEILYKGNSLYLLESKKEYTPEDIVWIKNVTNETDGEAYMNVESDTFTLHFPEQHKTNARSPNVGELILIRQKVNNIPCFTHIVTPIDHELIDAGRQKYPFGRSVKIIAKVGLDNLIRVDSTVWNRVNFAGITQGNVCKIENINSAGDTEELRSDVWKKFSNYFLNPETVSSNETEALLKEIETNNPELSATEGKLKLIEHYRRERNPQIVRQKKEEALKKNSELPCEVCFFSFPKTFNHNFIECHHLTPISSGGIRETRLEDLVLVCANCHRMLHTKFDNEYLSIDQLRQRIL